MLLKKETIAKKVEVLHPKTRKPFWALRYSKLYTYQCDSPNCGKVFETSRKKNLKYNYCSRKCPYIGISLRRNRHKKICPNCSKEFSFSSSEVKRNRKYCCRSCFITHVVGSCLEEGCDKPITARMVASRTSKTRPQMFPEYCTKHKLKLYIKADRLKLLYDLGNKCVCCGERDFRYLQFDHVNNDGNKHRQELRSVNVTVKGLIEYIEKNPGSIQILCANCNSAKNNNGGKLYIPDKFTQRKCLAA